jgi:hypothetical protein
VVPGGVDVRNPTGANMGFRRQAIIDAGGFSSRLGRTAAAPSGCEETELSIRIAAQRDGAHIVSIPGAVCHHRVPAERTTWRYFRARCVAEGRSKAVVSRLGGYGPALADERAYTAKTLPRAVSRAVRHGHLRRAGAIVAGLCFAALGFLPGLIDDDVAEDERLPLTLTVELDRPS